MELMLVVVALVDLQLNMTIIKKIMYLPLLMDLLQFNHLAQILSYLIEILEFEYAA